MDINSCMIFRCKWVGVGGNDYRTDAAIVYAVINDLPQVGQICKIFLVNGDMVIFECECFTTYYNNHYRAYVLQAVNSISYFEQSKC